MQLQKQSDKQPTACSPLGGSLCPHKKKKTLRFETLSLLVLVNKTYIQLSTLLAFLINCFSLKTKSEKKTTIIHTAYFPFTNSYIRNKLPMYLLFILTGFD